MAKVEPGIIPLRGKYGNDIIVKTSRDESHTRKVVAAGTKKDEPALKQNYERTALLNSLAGELNAIIRTHSGRLRSRRFYQQLLSRFYKEPLNNRWLLFRQLRGMEINPKYSLSRLFQPTITIRTGETEFVVDLAVVQHPREDIEADSYYYEVLLVQWGDPERPALAKKQLSELADMQLGRPIFEFSFPRSENTVHWLLCVRQRLCLNNKSLDSLESEGMQIIDIGTFDPKDLALLSERERELEQQAAARRNKEPEEEPVRVKAKRLV